MNEFKFRRNDVIPIPIITNEDSGKLNLSKSLWCVYYGGDQITINWNNLHTKGEWFELFKAFIAHRFETTSPRTVYKDIRMISDLDTINTHTSLYQQIDLCTYMEPLLSSDHNYYYSFKAFIRYCLDKQISFDKQVFKEALKNLVLNPSTKKSSYSNLQEYHHSIDHNLIDVFARELYGKPKNFNSRLSTSLFLIAYELGLRSIQIHALNIEDLIIHKSDSEIYYSLNVSSVKKRNQLQPVKRKLAITAQLGELLYTFISNRKDPTGALFMASLHSRLLSREISSLINQKLSSIGIDVKGFQGKSILRHHLAQSMADQGSPAELISNMLGHSSLVAAKAYIANTPDIAEIKTRALGKSKRFSQILNMLNTGTAINKDELELDRAVFGVVGHNYIGGIGGCDLENKTPCPKNPIYSCYTCQKFHPFSDGDHSRVLKSLRMEAQEFLDHASRKNNTKFNRTIEQLEFTIESVEHKINELKDES